MSLSSWFKGRKETALSYYDLIPEKTPTLMSAAFLLHKSKWFTNAFGTFIYQDVPPKAYPFGTRFVESRGRKIEIAGPEKALCDTLSKTQPLKDEKELTGWLYSFMRMEEEDIAVLEWKSIVEWVPLYKKGTSFYWPIISKEDERMKSKLEEMMSRYPTSTLLEKENALKEVIQEIILYGLSRTDFSLTRRYVWRHGNAVIFGAGPFLRRFGFHPSKRGIFFFMWPLFFRP